MTDYFISPTGSGNLSGSGAENASVLSKLNTILTNAQGGDRVILIADQGAYTISSSINISASASGTDGAPISIVGMSSSGQPLDATFIGNRADVYSPSAVQGAEVFRLLDGVSNLKFENMDFQKVATAFRFAGDVSDVTIEHVAATNVSRFIENLATGSATTATVSNLVVRDVDVDGFAKGVIRLQYDSHDILIEDVNGDSQFTDGANFAIGIALDGTAHDVVIRDTTMGNIIDSAGGGYWNGDGYTTERGVHDVLFENTLSYNNSDSGYDIKSTATTLLNAVAEGNTRNFRFWSDDTVAIGIKGVNPTYHGGSSTYPSNVWLGADAHVDISDSTFVDDDNYGFLFDLGEAGTSITVDNVISNQAASGFAKLPEAILESSSSWVWGNVLIDSTANADTVPKDRPGNVDQVPAGTNEGVTTWTGTLLADFLNGSSTRDTLWGRDGNDTLNGLGGDDSIYGGNDADIVSGGAGNDFLVGEGHKDTIYGDAGNDLIIGDFAAAIGGGNDKLYGGDGNDIIYGDGITMAGKIGGKDYVYGGAGNDVIFGDAGTITAGGTGGDDVLSGEDGDDIIYGDGAASSAGTAGGDDRISGGRGNDMLYGGAGSDKFVYDIANFGNDLIQDFTQTGSDRDLIDVPGLKLRFADLDISYEDGNATVSFPTGGTITVKGVTALTEADFSGLLPPVTPNAYVAPTLSGGGDNDSLAGGIGVDVINGEAGNDVIDGGGQKDRLYGDDGNDHITGGSNIDVLFGDAGADTLIGDFADAAGALAPASDKLFGGEGNDVLYGDGLKMTSVTGGNDMLYGERGNDVIFGDADYLAGTAKGGDDVIYGDAGADIIYGDSRLADARTVGGDDRINGGFGNDQMWGGGGNDTFVFDGIGFGKDVIGDFSRTVGNRDLIDLSLLKTDFDHLSISQIHGSTVIALDSGDSITLTGVTSVTAADFVF